MIDLVSDFDRKLCGCATHAADPRFPASKNCFLRTTAMMIMVVMMKMLTVMMILIIMMMVIMMTDGGDVEVCLCRGF